MDNINEYLVIVACLMGFYVVLVLYLKYGYKQAVSFTPLDSGIPDIERQPQEVPIRYQPNVYETEDTRMQYPLLPPVSPMVRKRNIRNIIPANPDLYTSQTYESSDSVLDTPPTVGTNELLYSGGDTELINIPLQFNYPYDEQLRSQPVLITPYNKVKYGNC